MNSIIKIYIPILCAVAFSLLFSSCEKEIDVELRSVEPRIVIEGIVKQDQFATVKVSHTKDFNDNTGYPSLSGAVVTISDSEGNTEVLKQDETGWYTAKNIKGVQKRTYNLSIVYEGEEYTATSTMPPHVNLDSLSMYKVPVMDYAFPMIHFQDPVGEENQYYRALLFIKGKQHPDMGEFVRSAELTDGRYYHQFIPAGTHDDDNDPYEKGDELTVEFQCIDKGAYTFFYTLSRVEDDLTNPISNISNGALGYFSACTAQQMSIIADWED
ncbi:MAG: DUF4249 domain-containing protein [Dysgonomonas sp.]|nr:DUF4249 domain-containing protein [Dysgonomonas sp.]